MCTIVASPFPDAITVRQSAENEARAGQGSGVDWFEVRKWLDVARSQDERLGDKSMASKTNVQASICRAL